MRHHDHASPGVKTPQHVWLKLVQTLLHLSVLLGGAFGLPQSVASAGVEALDEAQTRGELTLARDGGRSALSNEADKRTPATSLPPEHPPAAGTLFVPRARTSARARSVGFAARVRSKHSTQPFQARAPPRKS